MSAQIGITVGDLVAAALHAPSDRPAFVMGEQTLTYKQLAELTFRLARALQRMSLREASGIAALLPNRPELFALRAAAAIAGLRYTPLAAVGATADHAYILGDADISLLVTDGSLAERAHLAVAACREPVRIVSLDRGCADSLMSLAEHESGSEVTPSGSEDDIDMLAYTGGTTGRQKGVMLSHRASVQNAMMTLTNWARPSQLRMLLCTPLSHSALLLPLPVLLAGGVIHLLPKFDPGAVLATIERQRITALLGVPTMLYSLLQEPSLATADLSSLQSFVYIASPIAPTKLAEAVERIGPIFTQWYGQTEAPNTITQLRPAHHDLHRPHLLASCGHPMAGVRVQLQDGEGREVEAGQEGEICVRGRLVMDGYWRNPQATAETLSGGWLHTGDIGRRDEEGFFYIVDRKKDMIISGGLNVYPREVEDVLARHPAVAQAAVIGVPDEKWGEAVRAFVVLRKDQRVDASELIALVRNAKGSHQAPKAIEFVGALPTTAVGKTDKQALRKPYWADRVRRIN